MSDIVGKDLAGSKYLDLYRVIICLDCQYPEDKPLISLYNSASPLNADIRHKIRILEKRNLTINEIAV